MNWLPILWVVVGVVLLLVLNMKFKLNSFVALFLVAILVGILNGIPLTEVMTIVKAGFGGTLGSLALIIGLIPMGLLPMATSATVPPQAELLA